MGITDGISTWRASLFGLVAALAFSISPIFIRRGLIDLPSPLLGVTIGVLLTTVIYGVILFFRRGLSATSKGLIPRQVLAFQIAAGILLAFSTWARWLALDLAPVGVVVALGRLSVPVVIFLAPLLVGQQLERVTGRVWLGALLIVAGSLLLIAYR